MEFGPIQLSVIGFDHCERIPEAILQELTELRTRGVIRLVDSLFVTKDQDGDVSATATSDFEGHKVASIGLAIRTLLDNEGSPPIQPAGSGASAWEGVGITAADITAAADTLEPGASALYLLIEHSWARGLAQAMAQAGGKPVMQGILTSDSFFMVGAERNAMVEAEEMIEMAEIAKSEALLDALSTVEIADAVADSALRDATSILNTSDEIRSVIAEQAVRALIAANLIAEIAAPEAISVLVNANLISAATLEAAEARAATSRR